MPPLGAGTLESAIGGNHPNQGEFAPVGEADWASGTWTPGARVTPQTAALAVYARHATRVLLELYLTPWADATYDYWMQRGPDHLWRAAIAGVPAGTLYGYRCWGPNWEFSSGWRRGGSAAGFIADVDANGHRYNPNKLLFDPYARELSHDRETPALKDDHGHHAGMYGTGPGIYRGVNDRHAPVVRREFDTGRWAPKGVIVQDTNATGIKPHIPQKDAIIYETHVRGLSRHPSSSRLSTILAGVAGFESVEDVPAHLRGTYAGAGYMAKYLKALGYTAVELLPVHEFANDLNPGDFPGWDRAIDEPPHGNYWGYMTYGFFAPDTRYAHDKSAGGPTREFKEMVRRFHDEGLEVYLDVVFNHTGEGGVWDASGDTVEIMSFRGFDNADYYALSDGNRYYWDSTGCGNNLDASTPVVQNLIKDSLRYWSQEMGVDGFRFDLATVLGRTGLGRGFQGGSDLLRDIAATAAADGYEVIAEAWDTASYHVGDFPPGWAEWNGEYRDAVRGFLKSDGNTFAFLAAINGDYHRFHDQGGPQKSVNFITAHDGFTLMDLVSYNTKNNGVVWPFGPSDGGSDSNLSWDSGRDQTLRRQRLRNFLTVQMFSRGVPMTLGGDEFGRTQNGNNNPYKIDSIAMWQNYEMIGSPSPTRVPTGGSGAYHDNYGKDTNAGGRNGLFLFLKYLIALRKAHPSLRQDRFGDLALDSGNDVTYWFTGPDSISHVRGGDRLVHWRIDGSAIGDADFLLCVNMHSVDARFTIPQTRPGHEWRRLVDTARWAEPDGNCWNVATAGAITGDYGVHAWSIVVLIELPH